jgi:hypothetical protein
MTVDRRPVLGRCFVTDYTHWAPYMPVDYHLSELGT